MNAEAQLINAETQITNGEVQLVNAETQTTKGGPEQIDRGSGNTPNSQKGRVRFHLSDYIAWTIVVVHSRDAHER